MPPKITLIRCTDLIRAISAVNYFLRHVGHDARPCIGVSNSMWVQNGGMMHVVYWTSERRDSVTCIKADA